MKVNELKETVRNIHNSDEKPSEKKKAITELTKVYSDRSGMTLPQAKFELDLLVKKCK